MAVSNHIFLGILILHIYVHAAPSDVSKLEDIAKVEQADDNLDAGPKDITESEDNIDPSESARQKRYYNPYGYGFPPINPVIYPNFNRRDEFNPGNFGVEDPLVQIHRRVQEIADIVRQPPPPQIPHVPIFYPVLFIPSFDCRCNTQPTGPVTPGGPNVTTRFPDMEDERQNWGFVMNDANNDDNRDDSPGQDFSRPISFDPIRLNRPNARPPPPVEHGTVQDDAGSQNSQRGDNSPEPSLPNSRPPPPPTSDSQGSGFNPPRPSPPPNRPPPPPSGGPPSPCDGAILTCCHRPQVVYDCFAIQGCPNFTSYGNPCDANSILRVIERFQQYYGTRSSGSG